MIVKENGFTLIEMLVSLVVGAFIIGSISWVTSNLAKGLEAEATSDFSQELLDAHNVLDKIISNARFKEPGGAHLKRTKKFLEFDIRGPDSLGKSGYERARLLLNNNPTPQLVLEFDNPLLPETIIVHAANELEISYKETGDQNGTDRHLVQIQLSFYSNDEENRHILSLYPRINGQGTCIFDPISQRCRS